MPLRTANIIGSGPNGLAAAITLAQAGVHVTVFERNGSIGGACSTAELTLPGFRHDVGSSVYPLGIASPFFRSLPLGDFGLRWIEPDAPLAHPFDDGDALTLEHSVDDTAAQLGSHDGNAWRHLFAGTVRDWEPLVSDFTRGLLRLPRHPIAMGLFGAAALLPARTLARSVFQREDTRALLAGLTAHAVIPLTMIASSATGLVLGAAAQATGWPIVSGGGGALTQALANYLQVLGGRIETDADVTTLADLPSADVTLFNTSASAMSRISGAGLSASFRTRLAHFKPGPGIFKIDYALSEPIPWRDPACRRAGTVHLGGSLDEIARSEDDAFRGRRNDQPFVLLTQPSLFDASRAPDGKHTAWAYCHVPNGSPLDRTGAIERQIERFAPGFHDCVLARRTWSPAQLESWNPNLIGGDIAAGAMTLGSLIARPTLRHWRTSNPQLYLASAATPPGGGVHGMSGHLAALAALKDRA
jgi:phytoene dehydrogenase-like protein